ncbi:hypothetical protein HJG60_010252 [Phyllostomus discolor]|uniref:Uncharacterized protein n=1 Tax=Phyllostomus discolor TaxID=89673 RepID=A0A834EK65_9CHIR|nr:hypothetical protein HJG60_010252 [Phyllostomus discolor]
MRLITQPLNPVEWGQSSKCRGPTLRSSDSSAHTGPKERGDVRNESPTILEESEISQDFQKRLQSANVCWICAAASSPTSGPCSVLPPPFESPAPTAASPAPQRGILTVVSIATMHTAARPT